MEDERETKRARQACENCRRKKTRCSGERPVCEYCARLGQHCVYAHKITTTILPRDSPDSPRSNHYVQGPVIQNTSDLAARLALIESRLGLGGHDQFLGTPAGGHLTQTPPRDVRYISHRQSSARSVSGSDLSTRTSKFQSVPPAPVIEALADTYFANFHNQPYSYFVEGPFRDRLADGSVPDYLVMAFAAMAARYSLHPYFEDRQAEAIQTYTKTAWQTILEQVFSSEHGLDLQAVQATNLLAIIDFTAGQHRLGFVKIGLAVRFAQGLRLNAEPDPDLPSWQQEEQRRVFWSVYVLDRFVSCSRTRPASIMDGDCTVMLPVSERNLSAGAIVRSPTLAILNDLPDMSAYGSLDHFALLVLVASTFGRVVRYNLQQRTEKEFPPWDFRSDFAKFSTILLSFESLLSVGENDVAAYIRENFATDNGFDRPRVGHFVYCRGLYHLSCCLLHHPFFLHRHFRNHKSSVPRSFTRASLRHCNEHAEKLTSLLKIVHDENCCGRGSFLGYFAVVAGSIHSLYKHSTDSTERSRAHTLFQRCLDFLQDGPLYWGNYPRMASALSEFQIDQSQALGLIGTTLSQEFLGNTDLEVLSRILDYSWLSDANRSAPAPTPLATPSLSVPKAVGGGSSGSNWGLFDDLLAGEVDQPFDIVGHGINSMFQRSGRVNDWWFNSSHDDGAAST